MKLLKAIQPLYRHLGQRCSIGEDSTKHPFLLPENLRDAKGRKPDDPNYDQSTLFIPPKWFDEQKISAGQRQWWSFKASNFDSLLLFKVGKFYEVNFKFIPSFAQTRDCLVVRDGRSHCGRGFRTEVHERKPGSLWLPGICLCGDDLSFGHQGLQGGCDRTDRDSRAVQIT